MSSDNLLICGRERSEVDRREVLLRVTDDGLELLRTLSTLHRDQMQTVGPALLEALQAIVAGRKPKRAERAASP